MLNFRPQTFMNKNTPGIDILQFCFPYIYYQSPILAGEIVVSKEVVYLVDPLSNI